MRRVRTLLLFVFGVACASAPDLPVKPAVTPEAEKPAFDLKKLLARELEPMKTRPFQLSGDFFKGEVEAAAEIQTQQQIKAGVDQIKIPLGTKDSLTCLLMKERKDVATLAKTVLDGIVKKTNTYSYTRFNAASVQGVPYITTQLQYFVDSPRGNLAGHVKLYVAGRLDSTIMCIHDELGFAKSIDRIVRGLLKTLQVNNPQPTFEEPAYRSVMLMSLGDLTVGFDEYLWYRDRAGLRMSLRISSSLMPRTAQVLIADDNFTLKRSNPKGIVYEARFLSIKNSEIDRDLQLFLQKDGLYQVKGELQGKAQEFQLRYEPGLPDDIVIANLLKNKVLGSPGHFEYSTYTPAIDPTTLTTVKVERVPSSSPNHVRMRQNFLALELWLDKTGMEERLSFNVGGVKFRGERSFSQGAL